MILIETAGLKDGCRIGEYARSCPASAYWCLCCTLLLLPLVVVAIVVLRQYASRRGRGWANGAANDLSVSYKVMPVLLDACRAQNVA